MSLCIIFLDVDGVLQPVKPNGLPANADLEELERRTDEESEWLFREGSDVQLGGEFQFRRVKGEFDLENVAALKELVTCAQNQMRYRRDGIETDARVVFVLSSTWRLKAHLRDAVQQTFLLDCK